MKRSSGILLPVSSLPSDYGIGTFGKEAYRFVDYLKKAGQSYWQILPIGPTSYGDSPYSSFSTYAGNPYFIDFDLLRNDKLLKKKEYASIKWNTNDEFVDYGLLYENRNKVLKIASTRFVENNEYRRFIRNNKWVDNYALFMSIKNNFGDEEWLKWPDVYRLKDEKTIKSFIKSNKEDIRHYKVIQYFFFKQYKTLKKYANNKGIKILGDCPIYVAMDSCDTWSNPELFMMDKNKYPTEVAAVPPDYFCESGQLWGNPIYNWKFHAKSNYSWWINRLKYLSSLYDAIRIDHFIGFDSYYSVKYGGLNAINGLVHKGPGKKIIDCINNNIKKTTIIAEDLGALTNSMRKLLEYSGYPGMKVMRFGFSENENNEHLPHMYKKNLVAYITSHDTETCMGWINNTSYYERNFINKYFKISDYNDFNWKAIETLSRSRANLCIIQAQDILGIADKGRMNEPSSLGGNNWRWRLLKGQLSIKTANRLIKITKNNDRV